MKISTCTLMAVILVVCKAASISEEAEQILSDINAETSKDDAADAARTRRSGDVLSLINSKLHSKIHLLGSLSSPGHIPQTAPAPDYGPPLEYGHKSFNLWSFKKAIFAALLQAVKAITGGVIALKGQIIKVKGHLVSAKGALLQTKGEAISNFGRHVATKALLTPAHVPASGTGYGHTSTALGIGTGYGVPSAPAAPVYGPPKITAPGPSYGVPGTLPPAPAYGPPASSYSAPATSTGLDSYSGPAPPPGISSYGPPPSGTAHNTYLPPGFPPSSGYGAPSQDYGVPLKRDINRQLPSGFQAGLLLLKPLPGSPSGFGLSAPQEFQRSLKTPESSS